MSLLLLPRHGVGNAEAFNNSFLVTKDGNPWQDGGGDTFDSTTGVQITNGDGWKLLGNGAYTAANAAMQHGHSLVSSICDVGVYAGWAVEGIFVCEIELGIQPLGAVAMRFACNTGYDNGSPTGVATKAFSIGQNSYELKTVWTTFGKKDSWNTTNETQITVTVVPYLAQHNAPGANPFTWSGINDDRDYRLDDVQRGATMYIQWGKVNVDAVQSWIIADLVESEEFAAAPLPRIELDCTLPGARCDAMPVARSPCSELWGQPFKAASHAIASARSNVCFGGAGFISGKVKEIPKGAPEGAETPVARKVLLWDESSKVFIDETWSDPVTGAYRFERIAPEGRYIVLTLDHNNNFAPVAADRVHPARYAA